MLKMKNLSIIAMVGAYLILSIGITMSFHVCGGRISSISLIAKKGDPCACGSKKMNDNCCKSKQLSLKIQTDHQKPLLAECKSTNTFSLTTFFIPNTSFVFGSYVRSLELINNSPPPLITTVSSLFLFNRNFRI